VLFLQHGAITPTKMVDNTTKQQKHKTTHPETSPSNQMLIHVKTSGYACVRLSGSCPMPSHMANPSSYAVEAVPGTSISSEKW
jgi:hypothetical protein